jgi:hypothetical protein
VANAGLAERVDRLAWGRSGRPADDRRLGPGGGAVEPGRRSAAAASAGHRRKSDVAHRRHRRASAPTDLMGGSSSRSTKHHFGAQDDECPRHLELAPCGRLSARVGELLRAVEGVGDPGTWPVRLQSGGSARSGPWGEPVLRQQSRRAVASGAEARPVASAPATDLAGCARPSRCAPRATRGATGELQAPPRVSPAPSDVVEESSKQSLPSSDPPSRGPGLV